MANVAQTLLSVPGGEAALSPPIAPTDNMDHARRSAQTTDNAAKPQTTRAKRAVTAATPA